MSGVIVATNIRSKSVGLSPACYKAFLEASTAKSLVFSPLAAIRRVEIPVRDRIHSSDVSTIFSKSALVITFDESAEAQDVVS